MSTAPPTLKDIAQAMGVSTTTVHRALQGKSGVSGKKSDAIRALANEMGYQANYAATALKRGHLRIIVAFPEASHESQYYYRSLWNGAHQFFSENLGYPIELIDVVYPFSPGAHGQMLQQLCDGAYGQVDGVLTLAIEDPLSAACLAQLASDGIPVALVGANLHRSHRLCCVKAQDELAGNLAAQLLCDFYPGQLKKAVIVTGNPTGAFPMTDQAINAQAFQAYMRANAPNAPLFTAYHASPELAGRQLRELLLSNPELYAVYSVSARHTIMACQVLEDLGLAGRVKLVGNDRFPESIAALERGTLTAIIDKKTSLQSYHAAQALYIRVVKHETPAQDVTSISPAVLLSCNARLEELQG